MLTLGMGTIKDSLRAVAGHAARARAHKRLRGNSHCSLRGGTASRLRAKAPTRGRLVRQTLTGREPGGRRLTRAFYCALVFGIIGGPIALFATGTGIKDGPWTSDGLIIALCLAVAGGIVGYFAGNRKPIR